MPCSFEGFGGGGGGGPAIGGGGGAAAPAAEAKKEPSALDSPQPLQIRRHW